MTKENFGIYDLKRIKKEQNKDDFVRQKHEKIDDPKKFLLLLFCPIKT